VPDRGSDDVKYMIMMFGSAGEMMEVASKEWITEMIDFMMTLNKGLEESGELIAARGLVDGSQAKTVSLADDGTVMATDGPYAEAKESLVGYWIVDVEDEARAVDICGRIVRYARTVELRQVADGPPDI
jgi:hypothetical protein